MGPEAKSNLVPNFIKASTPDLLRELMLERNLILGCYVPYFDIQQSKDGNWYAWFFEAYNLEIPIKKVKAK